ncbi:hypothetical protein TrRE_jg7901 [Triparma retinervis]|uniref:Uncharacterized protein n=1 Tax=Triparma retinervis TaxID=2557542 RepID=A0A9W7DXE4_9STRA|nr:hypothetical protein TrRE_jg7901 [Triparma retinervis]
MPFDPTASIEHEHVPLFEDPYLQTAYDSLKFLFAVSPLLALFVVIYNGFETKEEEEQRRNKKEDFTLAGHGD